MTAFHGKQEIKDKYLNRVREHRRLDHLIQGVGWESNGTTKGCAVGCTLEKYDHAAYETELGIPQMVARLEDCIFEGLPKEKAMEWPERFLSIIQPGADLSLVGVRFLLAINRRNLNRLKSEEKKLVGSAIGQVIEAARAAAWAAAWAAARAVALAEAWEAEAWEAEAWEAEAPAWEAEAEAEFEWMADTLIKFLEEAPAPAVKV